MNRLPLLPIATVLTAACSPSSAQMLVDPIPEKIAKSDARVEFQTVAEGLVSPVLVVASPDSRDRLIVVDQAGLARVIEKGKLTEQPFLDVTDRLARLNKDFDEKGFLGLAFDPDYLAAGKPGHRRIFTYTSEKRGERSDFPIVHGDARPDHQAVVASWKVKDDGLGVDPASRKEVLRVDEPQFNHNGGMVAFGPDKLLYIGLGDGGGGNDLGPGHNPETGNAQDKNVLLGKMLRIDINGTNSANGAYGIPKDNPFAESGGAKEIFAVGLRNPWRFSFDGKDLWVGDVGQNSLEMVYKVERGGNYGWRLKEGTFKFDKNGTVTKPDATLPEGLSDPVLQYDHDEGTTVIGGHVYRGKSLPAIAGKYVFADYRRRDQPSTGRLFVGDLDAKSIREIVIGKDDRPAGFLPKGFGQDADGELYITGSTIQGPSGTTGKVVKIVPVKD